MIRHQVRVGAGVALVCAAGMVLAGCGKDSKDGKDGADGAKSPARSTPPAASASPPGQGPGDGKPSGAASDAGLPALSSSEEAKKQLNGLTVAKPRPMTGYSRDKFPHWAQQGNKCDTRETILGRDGKGVKRDAECRAVSGSWQSLYDGKTFSAASQVDIDHIVPLANAWRSGADQWTTDRRKALANDLTHPQLLTVSAATNRSKGDQSPDQWQPPAKTAWCAYGRAWTSVKSTYGLTITEDEKKMLTTMLGTCTS
ncbi:HNH endonuclease family protein [Streptomyces rectiverticillatus]|uniref:HNH endonuclease family protein n=1 Tax=Streptomyces rectiverticillatus TaxID=173860 RepID=UPI001FECBA09|nr:HNH endonuclease family protein [Streptomyces rectiverticillatus]